MKLENQTTHEIPNPLDYTTYYLEKTNEYFHSFDNTVAFAELMNVTVCVQALLISIVVYRSVRGPIFKSKRDSTAAEASRTNLGKLSAEDGNSESSNHSHENSLKRGPSSGDGHQSSVGGFKVPSALIFLSVGICTRLAMRRVVDGTGLVTMTQLLTHACLGTLGLVIGSHINAEAFAAVISQDGGGALDFLVFLIMVLIFTYGFVYTLAAFLLPSHALYARLAAAVALERSSPEALAGVMEAKCGGAFATSTILTSAIMDISAVIVFAIACGSITDVSSNVDGNHVQEVPSTTVFLLGLAVRTVISMLFTVCVLNINIEGIYVRFSYVANAVQRCFGRKSGSTTFESKTIVERAFRDDWLLTGLAIASLVVFDAFFETEIIAAAMGAGMLVNWNRQHVSIRVIEHNQLPIELLLFTLAGLKTDVMKFSIGSLGTAVLIFLGRLGGLTVGTSVGSLLSGASPPFYLMRSFGLVTQIAIALALVNRMEAVFPESAPLAMASLGSVLINLVVGPMMLQYSLKHYSRTMGTQSITVQTSQEKEASDVV